MNSLRPLMTALAFTAYIAGLFLTYTGGPREDRLGHTLAITGAILIAGLFIGVAIIETGRRWK